MCFFSFYSFSKNRFIPGKRVKEKEYKMIAIENHYFAISETKSQEFGISMDERESQKEEVKQQITRVYEIRVRFGSWLPCVHSKASQVFKSA